MAVWIAPAFDGVVHWQGYLQNQGPDRENVEVHCSHTGMDFHAEVFRIVAERLAFPEARS